MNRTPRSPDPVLREGVAFALLPGIGSVAFREGVERHGSAAAAFAAAEVTPGDRDEASGGAAAILSRASQVGATVLLLGDAAYPEALLELSDAPAVLYALGDLSLLARRRVGIVGTRRASADGERVASRMGEALARSGVTVVSGMALGIDAAAHRGALDGGRDGGGTVAVLGSGVDLPYPPSHAALHARIAREGLVLSEAPVGSHPTKGAFPRRNRIIAALSEPLVVVEAGDRSGALITARLALELGRTVAAVPGPIDSPRHAGTNRLLAEGASFIESVSAVLSLTGLSGSGASRPDNTSRDTRYVIAADDPAEAAILAAIATGVAEVDGLVSATRLGPRQLATALASLELVGRVVIDDRGTLSLRP